MTFIKHQKCALGSICAVAALAFAFVVQAKHCWCCFLAHCISASSNAVFERWEKISGTFFICCLWMRAKPHAGDYTKGSLAADEKMSDVASGSCSRCTTSTNDRAIGQHDFEGHNHVFDFSIAGRKLASAATGNPATDRCNIKRLREMTDGDSVFGLEFALHVWAECSWKHFDNSGHLVNRHDAGKLCGVEHDSAKHRHCASTNPATPTACGECDVVLTTNIDNGHHFIRVFWAANGMRFAWCFAGQGPMHGEWPPVAAMFGAVGIIHRC